MSGQSFQNVQYKLMSWYWEDSVFCLLFFMTSCVCQRQPSCWGRIMWQLKNQARCWESHARVEPDTSLFQDVCYVIVFDKYNLEQREISSSITREENVRPGQNGLSAMDYLFSS